MPLTREAPTLSTRLYRLVKELLEELLLLWMKFKAWLTPGTADDEVIDKGTASRQTCACLLWRAQDDTMTGSRRAIGVSKSSS